MRFLQKFSIGFLIFVLAANGTFAWFDDVDDELAPNVIEFLLENGVGEATQKFYPNRPVKLADFLVMGLALAGVEENDLPSVKGDRLIPRPRRTLRKGEATALGLKIFGIGVAPTTDSEDFDFADLRTSHRFFLEISHALKMGVIEPTSDAKFGTTEIFTRADAANLFFKLANLNIPNPMLFEIIWDRDQIEANFLFKENIDATIIWQRSSERQLSETERRSKRQARRDEKTPHRTRKSRHRTSDERGSRFK